MSLAVYVDRNAGGSTGAATDALHGALGSVDGVETVDRLGAADVVHLTDLNAFAGVVAGKESRARHAVTLARALGGDRPVVVTEHGCIHFTPAAEYGYGAGVNYGGALSAAVRAVSRAVAARADAVVAISESVRRHLIEGGVPGEKVSVVRHGVAGCYADRLPTATGDDRFVLHVSSYSPRKNPDAVFRVGRRLDAPLVVAGPGWAEHAPADASGVEFRGFVPEAALLRLYNRATAFYFPSLHEGFGLPVLEAMATGTAVVASDAYAIPEVTGDAAVLRDPRDVDGHVAALESLLGDDARREELEAAARERSEEFTWRRAAERTAAVYRAVVDGG